MSKEENLNKRGFLMMIVMRSRVVKTYNKGPMSFPITYILS